jgi:hypothetical protein
MSELGGPTRAEVCVVAVAVSPRGLRPRTPSTPGSLALARSPGDGVGP